MESTVTRWGNSLAIRIPKAFASAASIAENSAVEIGIEGDRIVIERAEKRWNLAQLVSRIDADNLHSPADWGDSKRKEAW